MKIALVHDYIKEYGGAERVLEALHEVWPEAPVFTILYLPQFLGPHRERFRDWQIRESWIKYIPFKEKLISPLRLITPLLFKQFDFSEFDVVIVSATGAYNPNMIRLQRHPGAQAIGSHKDSIGLSGLQNDRKKKPVHICYCHTPPRYLYGYATAREWKKNIIFKILGETANHFLRLVDYKSAQNVDYFIANSQNVAERIKKFYRRNSMVIYPPVDVQKTQNTQKTRGSAASDAVRNSDISDSLTSRLTEFSEYSGSYFLAGGRLARPKNIDLIVRACQELNLPLKVFGKGFAGYEREILSDKDIKILSEKKSPSVKLPNILVSQYPNISFLGEVTDEEKYELMRNAKAYIFASVDEDFGITPVEAMVCGTPVIAYRSGGVRESVVEGKTGIFFDELTVESLSKAIQHFDDIYHLSGFKSGDCAKQAQKFSQERFKKEIKTFVESRIMNHESRSHNS